MTLKIREWKKDRLVKVKNKPFTLVRTNRLRNHLEVYVKPTLTDTYVFPNKKGVTSISEDVIVLMNKLDEIVRNEAI